MMRMILTVNGEPRETDAATVADFLTSCGLHTRLVVVEHNGEIVPRDHYEEAPLRENDGLEIVQMMSGG